MATTPKITLLADPARDLLTPEVLALVAMLTRTYAPARDLLLAERSARLQRLREGATLQLDPATAAIRDGDWTVPPAPGHLTDRRCEITGPADRKMMVSALNSGARVFLCDLEDALSPTWTNIVQGHRNIRDAAEGTLDFDRGDGVVDEVDDNPATIVVRPRGLHLDEPRVLVDGKPCPAGLFDIAVLAASAGPAFAEAGAPLALYLPKIEAYPEAQWWDALIGDVERRVGLAPRSVRVTVLIETISAALQMDEIVFALRERITGLNAGRWDYLFSIVKQLGHDADHLLPDRSALTMSVPFMAAYAERLVAICHRRGAHAIGGMAPFVPQRDDPEGTARALEQTRIDKQHEADLGYDGTWVAHPVLVPIATAVFDAAFGDRTDQLHITPAVPQDVSSLLVTDVPGAQITAAGVRSNVAVALGYLSAWLGGRGAVAIDGRMEDMATAEIARCQLWQWTSQGVSDEHGEKITVERVQALLDAEVTLHSAVSGHYGAAAELIRVTALLPGLPEFLTLSALEEFG
jgi:malate synthase